MSDDSRDGPGLLAAALVVLLLAAAGGGLYFVVMQRGAARQAERAARDAAEAQRQPSEVPVPSDAPQVFEGKVVQKPGDNGLALVADDGTSHPVIEDDGSRMLFLDGRLRDRPVRLTAVLTPGTGALRVVCVQTVHDGQVYDVDYWCDVCQISISRPGPCYCCGEETVFRERPAR
jgi:hypothetical protein